MMEMELRDNLGRFVKDSIPWNKGKIDIYSEGTIEKMRKAKLGKHPLLNFEFKKGHLPWNKGMKGLQIKGSEKGWLKKGHKWSNEIEKRMLENLREKTVLKPNLEMNENLAYIVGLLKGDGHVGHYDKSYRIVLDNTNKNIAINFLNSLKNIKLNPFIREVIPSNNVGKQKQFRVIAHSKKFYEWYKQLTIEKIKTLLNDKEKIIGFMRGFYEAEGSIWKSNDGNICIAIHNTDLELLKLTKFLLENIGLNFHLNGPYRNRNLGGNTSKLLYRVQTGSKLNVFNFLNLIKPSIKDLK